MLKHRFPCYYKRSEYITGHGLFCQVDIPPRTIFVIMDGELITDEEYSSRFLFGKGGYAHRTKKNELLDCYDKCHEGLSMGSKSNSALRLFHPTTKEPAINNALLSYDPKIKMVCLKSGSKTIRAHTEIFNPYGKSYNLSKFSA